MSCISCGPGLPPVSVLLEAMASPQGQAEVLWVLPVCAAPAPSLGLGFATFQLAYAWYSWLLRPVRPFGALMTVSHLAVPWPTLRAGFLPAGWLHMAGLSLEAWSLAEPRAGGLR